MVDETCLFIVVLLKIKTDLELIVVNILQERYLHHTIGQNLLLATPRLTVLDAYFKSINRELKR
jgi:hypothetical protein